MSWDAVVCLRIQLEITILHDAMGDTYAVTDSSRPKGSWSGR